MCGLLTGVAQELIKNLVLKGVAHVDMMLLSFLSSVEVPTGGQLFASTLASPSDNEHIAQAVCDAARILNPTVDISFRMIEQIERGDLNEVSMLFLVGVADHMRAGEINIVCRQAGVPFGWLLSNGFRALLFNDFGPSHTFIEERKKREENGEESVERTEHSASFIPLAELWQKHQERMETYTAPRRILKSIPLSCSSDLLAVQREMEESKCFGDGSRELPPVSAILGAMAAQEAVKAITAKDRPLGQVVLFDGRTLDSQIIEL